MRASRLLQILLILQNRGRQTSAALATELEVTPRTILRDVDAMTEAGLPIIVHQGNRGGIELGFNYRTRLTGLAQDEAEALGILLNLPAPMLDAIGLQHAASRARAKLIESLPDKVRQTAKTAAEHFGVTVPQSVELDQRIPALANAIRNRNIVKINARSRTPQIIHPVRLVSDAQGWTIHDISSGQDVSLLDCGDINVSAKSFPAALVQPARQS